jgi:hypothetical protein
MRTYRWVKLGVSLATVAATLSIGGVAHAATETDVALHAATTATVLGLPAPTCSAGSGPDKAVDGASSNIYTDKWCVPSGQPTLTINLSGSAYGYTVSHVVVKHAGVAGESTSYNTRAFRLRVVQTSSSTPLTVATVTGNPASETSNTVTVGNVSQVQLLVDQPTQALGATSATRIYEVEVWGTPSTTPAPPPTGTCLLPGQKVGNPGFESGELPWIANANVISATGPSEPPHSGTRAAWMDGYGTAHTDTVSQTVIIPVGCKISLAFWLHIDTAETSTTTAFDKLQVSVNSTTIATFSNLNAAPGYVLRTIDVSQFAGLTVTLKFSGTEDASLQTSFVIDDVAMNAS